MFNMSNILFLSRMHALSIYWLVCWSIGWLVGPTVGNILLFFMALFLGPHCSCPNGLVTPNMAPAHPHSTSVAVYPALFCYVSLVLSASVGMRFQEPLVGPRNPKKWILHAILFRNDFFWAPLKIFFTS